MELEKRIARLESSANRWRVACLVCVCGIAMMFMLGAVDDDAPKDLKATSIMIVGADGSPGAVLKSDKRGGAALYLLGADRKPLVTIGSGNGEGFLSIAHAGDKSNVTVVAGAAGPGVQISGANGATMTRLWSENGEGRISIYDRKGATAIWDAPPR